LEKYGFVYIWFDRHNYRFYIGCHWGTENDGYICSSDWMRKSFRRRPNDFKRRIITRVYTNRQELLEVENQYLSLIKDDELGKKYYNLTKYMNGHWTTDPDKLLTIGEKISKKNKENPDWGSWSKGKKASEETRKKMSESKKGKPSPNKGKPMSDDQKRKISETKKEQYLVGENSPHYGKTFSEEHRKKLSEWQKGCKRGPMSEETKAKISKANSGQNNGMSFTNRNK
jgi:hypothetical protein